MFLVLPQYSPGHLDMLKGSFNNWVESSDLAFFCFEAGLIPVLINVKFAPAVCREITIIGDLLVMAEERRWADFNVRQERPWHAGLLKPCLIRVGPWNNWEIQRTAIRARPLGLNPF
jgi:hypothetical protein